jgi:hypothetical protein
LERREDFPKMAGIVVKKTLKLNVVRVWCLGDGGMWWLVIVATLISLCRGATPFYQSRFKLEYFPNGLEEFEIFKGQTISEDSE